MKAGVYRDVRKVVVEDVEEPRVTPEGVLLEVKACGICGSDLHMFASGTMAVPGQVMGHEFAGEVVEVGDGVEGIAVGDRLVAMPLIPCGECPACLRGEVELCLKAFAPGIAYGYPGAFAERVLVPRAKLGETVFPMPENISYEAGALAEPLAVAVHTVDRADLSPSDVVVVLGLGPVGQLIGRVLAARGIETVVGVDRSAYRRRWAVSHGMAVADSDDADLEESVRAALPEGAEIDCVFEVTGAPSLPNAAATMVRKGGTVVIVGVYDEFAPIDVSLFAVSELRILGTSAYVPADFEAALRLLDDGTVGPDDVVSDFAPLPRLAEMFERQLAGTQAMKALIQL